MRKGSKHSEKSKQLIRIAQLGNHHSPSTEFKKGSKGFTGKHSEESKERNRVKHLGMHHSPSTEFKKGIQSGIPIQIGQRLSPSTEFKKGSIPIQKGKSYREIYGDKKAKDILHRMHIKSKAIWNTPEKRLYARERRQKQVFPIKDTKIEVKIQDYLKQLGIEFETHKYIPIQLGYQTDIFIPSKNLIIECDGDYWHGNTKLFDFRIMPQHVKEQIPLDFERTNQLEEKGFKVLRLWENEIKKMSIDEFKNRVGITK
jgi:very-short-patch-repair endonuclease